MSSDSRTAIADQIGSNEEMTEADLQELMGSPVNVDEPLVEENVFQEAQPSVPIYKSIPLKTGLAALVSLLIILPLLALFSGSIFNGPDEQEATSTSPDTEAVEETEEEKALRESEESNTDLKRQLALQNQSFTAAEIEEEAKMSEMASADSTTSAAAPPPGTVSNPASIQPTRPPVAQPVVSRSAPPVRTVAPPPPLPRPRPVATAPASSTTPTATTLFSSRSPVTTIDFSELANDGSYGSLPQVDVPLFGATNSPDTSFQTLAGAQTTTAAATTIPVSFRQTKTADSREIQGSTLGVDSPVAASYQEERALIMGERTPVEVMAGPSTIPPGSMAEGQISRPISWTPDMPAVRGTITLTSPLMGGGYEVLPPGTEIMVEVSGFSQSGAVELRPTAIMLSQESALNLSIPPDAIQILASDGGYPIAQVENGSEAALRGIDRQQAFLGALSGAGQFINRPDSESRFLGAGGSSSTRDYGDGGSVLAAIIGGAADEVLRGRSGRLATQAEMIADRPLIWTLPSGTDVQIFVNQAVQL